jgi:hypothetical protein
MKLLKIGTIFLSLLFLNKICFADKADDYWNEYQQKKVSLVAHLRDLSTCSQNAGIEEKQRGADAIVYFISTGGKNGFRKAPATADEIKILANALFFSGKVMENDFSQTSKIYRNGQVSNAEIVTHLDVAQKIFSLGNKPLLVYFHPLEQTGDRVYGELINPLLTHAPLLGRVDVTRDSFDIYAPSASNKRWFDENQFKGDLGTVASRLSSLSFESPEIKEMVKRLEVAANIERITQDVLARMDHRHPSKVVIMGESMGGIIAPLVAHHITRYWKNAQLSALIINSAPVIWVKRDGDKDCCLPKQMIMNMPNRDENFPKALLDWSLAHLYMHPSAGAIGHSVHIPFSDTNGHLETSDAFRVKVAERILSVIPRK